MKGIVICVPFWYDDVDNVMRDQFGDVVYDIFRFIPPNLYNLYKKQKGTYYIDSRENDDIVYEFKFEYPF
jgi:hypothetical protein